jgi:hypothetical protein
LLICGWLPAGWSSRFRACQLAFSSARATDLVAAGGAVVGLDAVLAQ